MTTDHPTLSVVAPCFNEEGVLLLKAGEEKFSDRSLGVSSKETKTPGSLY